MEYIHDYRCVCNAPEEDEFRIFSFDSNREVSLPNSILTNFLNQVPCANFSRTLSAWSVAKGSGKELAKFKWFATE